MFNDSTMMQSTAARARAWRVLNLDMAEEEKEEKVRISLNHDALSCIFRSTLSYSSPGTLAVMMQTSRQTKQYAARLLYRTIFLDLTTNRSNPAPRPSPLQPPASQPNMIIGAPWISAEAYSDYVLDYNIWGSSVIPSSTMARNLDFAHILETGGHSGAACKRSSGSGNHLLNLQIWRFRADFLSDDSSPYIDWCGADAIDLRECRDPMSCWLAESIAAPHIVFLSKSEHEINLPDPLQFLDIRKLQRLRRTVRKLTITLSVDRSVPEPSVYNRLRLSHYGMYGPSELQAVRLAHIELLFLPDTKGDLARFAKPDFWRTKGPLPVARRIDRIRDTIVARLCDTNCHIRLIGSELLQRALLLGGESATTVAGWDFEEDLRCAVDNRKVSKAGSNEGEGVRTSRQDRLTLTSFREYIFTTEAADTLGDDEVNTHRRAYSMGESSHD